MAGGIRERWWYRRNTRLWSGRTSGRSRSHPIRSLCRLTRLGNGLLLAKVQLPDACELRKHHVDQLELVLCCVDILYALLYLADLLLDSLVNFEQPVTNGLHCREVRRICCGEVRLRCRWGIRPIKIDAHSVRQLCHLLSTLSIPQSDRAEVDVSHGRPRALRLLLPGLSGLPVKLRILPAGCLIILGCGLILPAR